MTDIERAAADGHHLTVLVPTLDEAPCVGVVLRGLLEQPGVDDVLVVDGGSSDGTQEIVRDLGVPLLVQKERGLGRGLAEGFRAAAGDLLAIVDADGSHDWTALPEMRRRVVEDGFDYVLASRYLGPFRWRGPLRWPWSTSEDDSLLHEWGNLGIVALARLLHGYPLHDMMMGLQLFRRDVLDALSLEEPGQAFDCEIKLQIHRAGFRMTEVPVTEPRRIGGEAKLSAWKDGLATARVLAREWRRKYPRRRALRTFGSGAGGDRR